MKGLYFLIFLLLVVVDLFSQPTFSKRVIYDYPSQLYASVEVDSNYIYCNGSVLDSVIPYSSRGLFAKYNLSGDLISFKTFGNAEVDFYYFDPSMRWTRNISLMFGGYSIVDKMQLGIINEYDTAGTLIESSLDFNLSSVPYSLNKIHNWLEYGEYSDIVIGTYIQNSPDRLRIALLNRLLGNVNNETIISHPYNIKNSSVLKLDDSKFVMGNDVFGTTIGDGIRRCNLVLVDTLLNWNLVWESSADSVWTGMNDLIRCPDGGLLACFSRGKYYNNESTYRFIPSVAKFNKSITSVDWIYDIPGYSFSSGNRSYNLEVGFDSTSFFICGMGHEIDNPPIGFSFVGFLASISYDGSVNWTRKYTVIDSKADYHYLYDMKKTADGGLVLVGQIVDLEAGAQPPIQQAWILKVDSFGCLVPGCELETNLEEVDSSKLDIRLYPNPVQGGATSLYANMPTEGDIQIELYSLEGLLVKSWSRRHVGPTTYILDMPDTSPGLHLIRVSFQGSMWSEKLFME